LRHFLWLNASLFLAIVVALALLASQSSGGRGIEIEVRDPRPGIDEIRVAVSGAVVSGGVFTVHPGDRVIDAVELAGGPTADADMSAVNLARRVVDQDQIVVPLRGEGAALIDINRATAADLDELPGIGPVYAAAVIAAREGGGAFATTDDLVERRVIPAHVYEGIRDLIVAR
jgi:competence protein ComEA